MDKVTIIVNYLKKEVQEIDEKIDFLEKNCLLVSKEYRRNRDIFIKILIFVNSIDN